MTSKLYSEFDYISLFISDEIITTDNEKDACYIKEIWQRFLEWWRTTFVVDHPSHQGAKPNRGTFLRFLSDKWGPPLDSAEAGMPRQTRSNVWKKKMLRQSSCRVF